MYQAHQARPGIVAQCAHARVIAPQRDALAKLRGQPPEQGFELRRRVLAATRAPLARLVGCAAQQFVKLLSDQFTVADAYLFVVLSWFGRLNVDFAPYPNLKAFHDRVKQRPAVVRAMTDEGLLKAA